jgi:hypothetical protein
MVGPVVSGPIVVLSKDSAVRKSPSSIKLSIAVSLGGSQRTAKTRIRIANVMFMTLLNSFLLRQ